MRLTSLSNLDTYDSPETSLGEDSPRKGYGCARKVLKPSRAIQGWGNGVVSSDQEVLKKKSTVIGWILLILGLIGAILAMIIWLANPHWVYGVADVWLLLGGFLVGIPMLIGGGYLVATASSYNRKVEGALIQKAGQPSQMYQPAPGSTGFCSHCGYQLVSATEFCPKCGKSRKD